MTLFPSRCVPNQSILQPQTKFFFFFLLLVLFFDDSSLCLHRVSILFYCRLYEANIFSCFRQRTPLFELLQNDSEHWSRSPAIGSQIWQLMSDGRCVHVKIFVKMKMHKGLSLVHLSTSTFNVCSVAFQEYLFLEFLLISDLKLHTNSPALAQNPTQTHKHP